MAKNSYMILLIKIGIFFICVLNACSDLIKIFSKNHQLFMRNAAWKNKSNIQNANHVLFLIQFQFQLYVTQSSKWNLDFLWIKTCVHFIKQQVLRIIFCENIRLFLIRVYKWLLKKKSHFQMFCFFYFVPQIY